jgi:N-acetyl-gamma-glutamyl-phosphate reductase
MSDILRVGILGAAGYAGIELVRLVHGHPRLSLEYLGARDSAGKRFGDVVPSALGITGIGDRVLEAFDDSKAEDVARRIDVAFVALHHNTSGYLSAALFDRGVRVVDLSADFRLRDQGVYESTYGAHPAPRLIGQAVYGQPELHRTALRGARLIAAPGCHVTTAVLPLAPLFKARLIDADLVIVDSKTGISGGGRAPARAYHYPETGEGIRPYKVGGTHRHVPEIEQELSLAHGAPVRIAFTPQLAPMTRGILVTAYVRPKAGVSEEDCRQAARAEYEGGLVTVLDAGMLPDTLWVRGSARAHVAYALDARTGLLLCMCATDNLSRGASAQAIQAFNVSMGWPDALGLQEMALFP